MGDLLPLCFTAEGCPVEDLATDEVVEKDASRFMQAKQLYRINGDNSPIKRIVKDTGLDNDLDSYSEIEADYHKWIQEQEAHQKRR